MDSVKETANLAVLIDADNAQPAIIEGLLAEVAKYGTANVKRIYGNWTDEKLRGWKATLLEHSIQPMQQFAYTTGKNATDSAMIIDAMDLLYTDNFDGFCIVSSDSDFTRLASRLRESGRVVYGFGEKKTPKPFVAACDKFIYTEVLRAKEEEAGSSKAKTSDDLKKDKGHLANLFRNAIDAYSDDDGWAQLGPVGSNIAKQAPEFDSRNYGYKRLKDLVKAMGLYELREEVEGPGHAKAIYIRKKRRKGTSR
jgi:uncharacterized LabA/DUF88 family protein